MAVRARARALAREEEAKRAIADAQVRLDRKEARGDAVDEKARELQAARSTMSSAMTALGVVGLLSRPILRLAERLAKVLDGSVEGMGQAEAFELLRQYSVLSASTSLVAKRAMECARLVAGPPGKHAGTSGGDIKETGAIVQPERALDFLGSSERVTRAAKDLYEGNLTPDALLLVESQALEGLPRN